MSQDVMSFKCIDCRKTYTIDLDQLQCSCGGLLEVIHDWSGSDIKKELEKYESNSSGVWRFKPLIHPLISEDKLITRGEGRTGLYKGPKKACSYANNSKLFFKHEGENPTGSFKDRGMTVALSEAKRLGKSKVICASTGNTSSSLAAFAAYGDLEASVVIPKGKVAIGKLAQAIAYGANVIEVEGTFDTALAKVKELASKQDLYLVNSINPWRLEGQKSIIFELLEQQQWQVPDYIVVPAGNLGNTSAFGKALQEAKGLDLIKDLPHIISVQATGANPFARYFTTGSFENEKHPNTLATAINIGDPVNREKAMKSIRYTDGNVISVNDQEILDAKAILDGSGIGCEPASAATLAGIKNLVEGGIILSSESSVAILTGHILKDPQIITDYHLNKIPGIKATYRNTNISS